MLVANCGSNGPQTCAIHLVKHCASLKYIANGKKEEKKKQPGIIEIQNKASKT